MSSPMVDSSSDTVRVRFAPSPTGYLHVGGARTALYNWLYAKKKNGKFILRVEDTDQVRSTEEALQMQVADLKWLGLHWDEGYDLPGNYGPYKQSERLDIYKKTTQGLLDSKKAYYCFCTEQELEKKKEIAQKESRPPHYDGSCRNLEAAHVQSRLQAGEKAAVRFRVDSTKAYTFQDLIRSDVTFPANMVGDFIILRSDGMPVYNYCCVVDDGMMKITHVLRAEEHLSNTLRQIMLYEAFAWTMPRFGHLSIILGEDRQKLSKRHGATSCYEFMKQGYLPEALLNFISLLGWSSPQAQEILSIEELIQQFDLDRMTSSPAVFDPKKFNWVNATHLRALPNADLWARLLPYLNEHGVNYKKDVEWQSQSLEAFKPSMETLMDGVSLYRFIDDSYFEIHAEGVETLKWKESVPVLNAWKTVLETHTRDFISEAEFGELQNKVKDISAQKGKFLFMPLRVAVIGKPHGTELKLLIPLIHKKTLIQRADKALASAAQA